jgi:hypothetical protein
MNRARQRVVCAVLFVLLVTGCQARSSVEAAQTAVVAVQTAVPASQSLVMSSLQALLAGANIAITTVPDGAANDAVTEVAIKATDSNSALAQVDPRARQATASAALIAAAQYYPNARILLTVLDASSTPLVSGEKLPGQPPSVQ